MIQAKNKNHGVKKFLGKIRSKNRYEFKRGTSSVEEIIQERMTFFENLLLENDPSINIVNSSRPQGPKAVVNGDRRVSSPYTNMVADETQDSTDTFVKKKTRTKVQYDEDELANRLKEREKEHLRVHRYKSILGAPLCQQIILNKFIEEENNPCGSENHNHNTFVSGRKTLDDLSHKTPENITDMHMLNSIKQPGKKPCIMWQTSETNQAIRWSDTEMVRSCKLLDKLSKDEILFQENQFELISSEASYYRSLNVLVDKFYNSPLLSLETSGNKKKSKFVIKAYEKEHLFSNILQIHSTSGKFLAALEERFTSSVYMKDVCDIVSKFAENEFQVYIPYLQNMKYQNELYAELKKNDISAKVIQELEKQEECCNLPLDSFLILPMQRPFRIRLLLEAIKKSIPTKKRGGVICVNSVIKALLDMDKIIKQCDAKKETMDERQRMLEISRCLTFKRRQAQFTISSGRLIHEGEVKCCGTRHQMSNHLSCMPHSFFDCWLILTDEYLLVTRLSRNKDQQLYQVEGCSPLREVLIDHISPVWLNQGKTSRQFTITFNGFFTYNVLTKSSEDYNKWVSELSICRGT